MHRCAATSEPNSQVRHGPNMYECRLELFASSSSSSNADSTGSSAADAAAAAGASGGHVSLAGSDQGLAAGQYAVFYQAGVCLGSAVIAGCDAV